MSGEIEYIDYTVFLGMNAASDPLRWRCKALVASRLERTVLMTWDHVGRCDDIIWQYSRELQDLYYPFMDRLHSHRCIEREGYEDSTLRLAVNDARLREAARRSSPARGAEPWSGKPGSTRSILVFCGSPSCRYAPPPECDAEQAFPEWLESLYRASLQLRVPLAGEESSHV